MNPRSEREFLKAIEAGKRRAELIEKLIQMDTDIIPEEYKMVKVPNEKILKIFNTFSKDE